MEDNKTYSVYCHTCPNGMQYFGMSCDVKSRWFPSLYKNGTTFKDAIERFGWENIKHEVLYSGLTRDEALKLEDELICKARENGYCLNARRSGHYTKTKGLNAYMREYMRELRKRKKLEKGQSQQDTKSTEPKPKHKKPLF